MKKEDCFELGYVTKTHGLDGELTLFFDVDDVSIYEEIETVLIEQKGGLVPYFIEYLHRHKDKFIAKFEEVDSLDAAKALVSSKLFLPLEVLPKLDEEKGQFYFHDIIGYTVHDKTLGKLGVVEHVVTATAQPLISMNYRQKEVLIPISDATVLSASHQTKTVNVDIPEGLIDIYLSEQNDTPDDLD